MGGVCRIGAYLIAEALRNRKSVVLAPTNLSQVGWRGCACAIPRGFSVMAYCLAEVTTMRSVRLFETRGLELQISAPAFSEFSNLWAWFFLTTGRWLNANNGVKFGRGVHTGSRESAFHSC